MRIIFYLICLVILSILIVLYFVNNHPPINLDKLKQDIVQMDILRNEDEEFNNLISNITKPENILNYLLPEAYITLFLLIFILWGLFVILHLLVDKLFFKLFYEKPNFSNAYRRGVFFIILIIYRIISEFYKLDINFFISLVLFLILIEYIVVNKLVKVNFTFNIFNIQKQNLENNKTISENKQTSHSNLDNKEV